MAPPGDGGGTRPRFAVSVTLAVFKLFLFLGPSPPLSFPPHNLAVRGGYAGPATVVPYRRLRPCVLSSQIRPGKLCLTSRLGTLNSVP